VRLSITASRPAFLQHLRADAVAAHCLSAVQSPQAVVHLLQQMMSLLSTLEGAIADVQPQFAVTDSRHVSERLAPALMPFAYCWRTLLERGVLVAGRSDSPIEEANPLLGIRAPMFGPTQQHDLSPDAKAIVTDFPNTLL